MTEEGKLYWLRLKGCCHPHLYLGETQASRGKYTTHVQKPSCCLVHKGGDKLNKWLDKTNQENEERYLEKKLEFDTKYPTGTVPSEMSPFLVIYEPVEVVACPFKSKTARGTRSLFLRGKVTYKLKGK